MTKSLGAGTSPSVTMNTPVDTNCEDNNRLIIFNHHTFLDTLAIIASIVGIVIIIVSIFIVVTIVAMKTSKQRKKVTLTQGTCSNNYYIFNMCYYIEMTHVRHNIAGPHE